MGNLNESNIQIDKDELILQPFSKSFVIINISIPQDIAADPDIGTWLKENYTFRITCVSILNYSMKIQQRIEVNVLPIYELSIERNPIVVQVIRYPDLEEQGQKNITFNVINLGNYNDSVKLSVAAPIWITLRTEHLELDYGAKEETHLIIKTNPMLEIGNYSINISCISENNNNIVAYLDLIIVIADFDIIVPMIKINGKQISELFLSEKSVNKISISIEKTQSTNFIIINPEILFVTVLLFHNDEYSKELQNYTITDLTANAPHTNEFSWTPDKDGKFVIFVKVDIVGGSAEDEINFHNNKYYLTINVDTRNDSGTGFGLGDLSEKYVFFFINILILILIIFFIISYLEIFKYPILVKIIRNLPKNYLKVKGKESSKALTTRNRIFNYIKYNPGASYEIIRYNLKLDTRTLIYNLRNLTKEGLVYSKRQGLKVRFFSHESANNNNRDVS
jgi:hypothetical protein